MNKTLLLIAAAAGAYALLRPKTSAPAVSAAHSPATGAASWAPTAPVAASPTPPTGPAWLSNLANGIETGVSIINTIKGALPHSASPTAPTTASHTAGGGVWAGPRTAIS